MKMILDNSYENRPVRVYPIYSPTLRTGVVFLILQDKDKESMLWKKENCLNMIMSDVGE